MIASAVRGCHRVLGLAPSSEFQCGTMIIRIVAYWIVGFICALLCAWAFCVWPTGFKSTQSFLIREPYGEFYVRAAPAVGVQFAYVSSAHSPSPASTKDPIAPWWRWTRLGERTGAKDWDARGVQSMEEAVARSQNLGLIVREVGAGWPLHAFRWHEDKAGNVFGGITLSNRESFVPFIENGQVRWKDRWAPLHLPILPIWKGVIFNSTVFGLLCAVAWSSTKRLLRSALRRIRIRRGACGACGYQLAGLNSRSCPECGSVGVEPGGSAVPFA
jgi:hypothetical protein